MAVKMADESDRSSAAPVTHDPDLEAALFAAFHPYLNQTPTLRRALRAAFDRAPVIQPTHGRTVVASDNQIAIDESSLMFGLIAAGGAVGQGSSARWLCEWLEGQTPELAVRDVGPKTKENAFMFARGCEVIASRSVRERVLPAALRLAEHTVGRQLVDARHLLFALLDEPASSFGPLEPAFAGEKRAELKAYIVERIAAAPEPNENVAAWRELVTKVEAVGTLSDAPALVDSLGRQAFAEVLATRVKQVSETLRSGTLGNDSAFILHVDGPWGSGKSSILNFLKTNLEQSDPPWVIVEFNAWRNQQRSPAWWPIISHVWTTVRHEGPFKFPAAYWVWMRWTMGMRWLPLLLSGLLIVAFAILVYWWGQAPAAERGQSQWIELMDKAWKGVLALMALGGFAWTSSRALFFGSKSAAETYAQSSAEPFRRIVSLYERLVGAIGRPVAVFIDDIDRCECDYVIELLEGIQTLLRSAPVVYVVAGDRKWICSSFEKRYSDFGGQIGMPGRPLGYLFLDKVFQLSTAIPRLSNVRQAAYWRRLLETGEQGAMKASDDLRKLEADAETDLIGKSSHEEIQQQIDDSQEGSLRQEALRAAAAKQTTSREAIRAAEHRLQPLAHLLEPNPRSMKRLVNAYGLNQARVFLEGRKVEVEALARWTIVELRWPILADYLATNWTDIADGSLAVAQFPESIRALLADSDVKEVFGHKGEAVQLTVTTLGPILE